MRRNERRQGTDCAGPGYLFSDGKATGRFSAASDMAWFLLQKAHSDCCGQVLWRGSTGATARVGLGKSIEILWQGPWQVIMVACLIGL